MEQSLGALEHRIAWGPRLEEQARRLAETAFAEDLGGEADWTTVATVDASAVGSARVVARVAGVACGLAAGRIVVAAGSDVLVWRPLVADGAALAPGDCLAELTGPAAELLTCERTLLNFLGRLCGVATLTDRYVAAAGARTKIVDTRKTTPGWRLLEKYAVACGGGWNHREGLHDAILIKDNHLAAAESDAVSPVDDALRAARELSAGLVETGRRSAPLPVEIEVDSLEQLPAALAGEPEVVLLDNFPPTALRAAVAMRDAASPRVRLEASGGVSLETVAEMASTGVDRISVGALTHSAPWFDVGLDWGLEGVLG